jgi:hypothetical protein
MAVPVETSEAPGAREHEPGPVAPEISKSRLSPRIKAALATLLEAHEYVRDLGSSPWEFAVELSALRRLRVSNSDLRWLVARGLVEHAVEVTRTGDAARGFRQPPRPVFSKRACFVLTPAGMELARELADQSDSSREPHAGALEIKPRLAIAAAQPGTPKWDRDRNELRVGSTVVKQFKLAAHDQEAVLAAFEEEAWAMRIDNPLAPLGEKSSQRRLQEALESLNSAQRGPHFRFTEDANGQGVRWEFCPRSP